MKNATRLTFALLCLLPILAAAGGDVVEEIVAVINDEVITLSQYKEQYEATVQIIRSQVQGEEYDKQVARLKTELLNMMITDVLLMQQAKEKGLNVNEQLKTAIENIKKENNLASDEDLARAIQQQGMTFEQWRKQLEENFLRQAVIYSEVDRAIVLDDAEVVQYYKAHPEEFTVPEEVKLRAIYLSGEGMSPADLEARRGEILAKVGAGEPFNTLATQYSNGPMKDSEGDLGTFKKGELEKTLEDAVAKLKVGETSPWVSTQNGWYLIKLEARTPAFVRPFEEAKKDAEDRIYAGKRQTKLEAYLKSLRERSYIKILKPNPLDL